MNDYIISGLFISTIIAFIMNLIGVGFFLGSKKTESTYLIILLTINIILFILEISNIPIKHIVDYCGDNTIYKALFINITCLIVIIINVFVLFFKNLKINYLIIVLVMNIITSLLSLFFITTTDNFYYCANNYPIAAKPVIYLYPERKENVDVKLNYNGNLIATYPDYDNLKKGWSVTAFPDGKLINSKDNLEYSYLFWEGTPKNQPNYDFTKGFVVKGENTKEFLQSKLKEIGLTPKEYNEFIVYWYPKMVNNKYNWIYFAGKEYTDNAELTTNPKADSILRVFMVFKALDNPINVTTQTFSSFERKGFSLVEWGGTEIK